MKPMAKRLNGSKKASRNQSKPRIGRELIPLIQSRNGHSCRSRTQSKPIVMAHQSVAPKILNVRPGGATSTSCSTPAWLGSKVHCHFIRPNDSEARNRGPLQKGNQFRITRVSPSGAKVLVNLGGQVEMLRSFALQAVMMTIFAVAEREMLT